MQNVSFADDIEKQIYMSAVKWKNAFWLKNAALTVIEHKTKIILTTKRSMETTVKAKVDEQTIYSQTAFK